jgi:hypothetical protein
LKLLTNLVEGTASPLKSRIAMHEHPDPANPVKAPAQRDPTQLIAICHHRMTTTPMLMMKLHRLTTRELQGDCPEDLEAKKGLLAPQVHPDQADHEEPITQWDDKVTMDPKVRQELPDHQEHPAQLT